MTFTLPLFKVDPAVKPVGNWNAIAGSGTGDFKGTAIKGPIDAGRSQTDGGGYFIEGIFTIKK
jgi:hypothetical protein